MISGVAVWRLSNKLSCLSAINYLTRGTKCIQSDLPAKLQIFHSYNFKDVSKCTTEKEQKIETYSFLVPCGRNKIYLLNSERDSSLCGIISLFMCNLRSRPIKERQELLSHHSSTMMLQILNDAGVMKSMKSLTSMQQMFLHLCVNNLSRTNGELKMCSSICGIHGKQWHQRGISTTEIVQDGKSEFCPPKKPGNKETYDLEETSAKTNAKADSKKECLTPKNQTAQTFCANGEGKNGPNSAVKASLQNSKGDSKKECLTPKNQAALTFCAKVEPKNESSTPKALSKSSAAQVAFCTRTESKKESSSTHNLKASATQVVNCAKAESKNDPPTSPKMQMKPQVSACPSPKGPDQKEQKPPKKEENKKSICSPKKNSDKKPPQKEEAKKDICGTKSNVRPAAPQEPKVCEPKEEKKPDTWIDCPPKIEEKKRAGCDDLPHKSKSASSATPDRPLKGNIPYPCPKVTKKSGKGDTIPIWQCGVISGFFLLLAIAILIWSHFHYKQEEPELDSKGRPIKKK